MFLIICYGNALRGDDGFGPAVAAYLKDRCVEDGQFSVMCVPQLLPEHAECIARAKTVAFVDVSATSEVGEINFVPLHSHKHIAGQQAGIADSHNSSRSSQSNPSFPHHLSPVDLLDLTESLYLELPDAFIYSVGAESFALGDNLSPLVAAAVPRVGEQLLSKRHEILMIAQQNLCQDYAV